MATDWTQEYRLKRLMLFRVVMITTLLLVTHSAEAAAAASRVIELHDGRVVEDRTAGT